jgi:DMSO/TMAO reductase YedYZ molybdopterin-dependent catalytic subunit
VRLLVPGWSGNWSVKWLTKLEVMEHEPDCWYHYQFYYYGTSPDDSDTLMSRASDEVGRAQSHEPRYNNMRKNFQRHCGLFDRRGVKLSRLNAPEANAPEGNYRHQLRGIARNRTNCRNCSQHLTE